MDTAANTKTPETGGGSEGSHAGFPRTLGLLVKGRNINEKTLLATDYLNHFNEIIMLLEMLSSMPECLEDVLEWRPKSYAEHFQDSCFADKELAILAYMNAPEEFRQPFDSAVDHMNYLIADGVAEIVDAQSHGDERRFQATSARVSENLRRFVDVTSAIIHGDQRTIDQAAIDRIMAS
jgi:hypothetical protein